MPKHTRDSRDDDSKLRDWEAAVKSQVLSFEVEQLSSSMAIAHWLPVRYSRRRSAYQYSLPETQSGRRASGRRANPVLPPPESVR